MFGIARKTCPHISYVVAIFVPTILFTYTLECFQTAIHTWTAVKGVWVYRYVIGSVWCQHRQEGLLLLYLLLLQHSQLTKRVRPTCRTSDCTGLAWQLLFVEVWLFAGFEIRERYINLHSTSGDDVADWLPGAGSDGIDSDPCCHLFRPRNEALAVQFVACNQPTTVPLCELESYPHLPDPVDCAKYKVPTKALCYHPFIYVPLIFFCLFFHSPPLCRLLQPVSLDNYYINCSARAIKCVRVRLIKLYMT